MGTAKLAFDVSFVFQDAVLTISPDHHVLQHTLSTITPSSSNPYRHLITTTSPHHIVSQPPRPELLHIPHLRTSSGIRSTISHQYHTHYITVQCNSAKKLTLVDSDTQCIGQYIPLDKEPMDCCRSRIGSCSHLCTKH